MTKNEDVHAIFDNRKIFISPELSGMFTFLIEIDKEVNSLLNFEKKLEVIRSGYSEMIDFVQFLVDKLKDADIDHKYTFKNDPIVVTDELNGFHLPLRSQMIVLFAYIEVLICLHIAYINSTDIDSKIMEYAMNSEVVKKFLNMYFLTEKNPYFKKHKKRFSQISAKQIRNLRNSLTHFFSVGKNISIMPDELSKKARRLEKALKRAGKQDSFFISQNDLFELVKGAGMIMIEGWSNDSRNDSAAFKKKIAAVQSVIEKNGAHVVFDKQLNV